MVAPAPPPLLSLELPAQNQLADAVSYVLLAEFDIDQGATLAHSYPFPTGTDEHALADLMLPDGAHLRAEDWTIFYLNQVPSNTVVDLLAVDDNSDAGADDGPRIDSRAKGKGKEKRELLYVLNCVRMKEDKTLRRGARVKALAVCTPHPFIQIYKPLLVLALEEYFQTPSPSVLARLFDSLNSIDTSAMPRLTRSEKHVLRSSERRDLFEEKFWAVGKPAGPPSAKLEGPGATARDRAASVAFGKKLGLGEDQDDASDAGPGSRSRTTSTGEDSVAHPRERHPPAIPHSPHLDRVAPDFSASTSPPPETPSTMASSPPTSFPSSQGHHPSTSPPRPRLQSSSSHLSLASSFVNSANDHHSSRSPTPSMIPIQQTGASMSIHPTTPYQQYTPYQPQTPTLGGFGLGPPPPGKGKKMSKDTHFFETGAWFRGISVPIRIPLGTFDEEVGDYSLVHLIQTFSPASPPPPAFSPPYVPSLHTAGPSTNPIILLFNALVTQRRVIFLGHGKAAGQVANFVLAACALGSGGGGILSGFTARAFPYANLAGLDMLEQVPGYIAGVTNPRFEDLPSRWDVLCNIETGRITISKDIRPDPPLPSPSSSSSTHGPQSSTASTANSSPSSTHTSANPFASPAMSTGTTTPFSNTPYAGSVSTFSSPSLGTDGTDTASIMTGITAVTDSSSVRLLDDEEKLISRATVVNSTRQSRSDSKGGPGSDSDAAFMEEIHTLIASHFGEAIIRTRFADYLHRFIRLAARYEEETYGSPPPSGLRTWHPTLACDPKRGRLGSGALLWDGELWLGGEGAPEGRRRDSEGGPGAWNERRTVREFVGVNGVKRIEGWRGTKSYELWQEDFNHSPSHRSELSFDLSHQLARLKNVTRVIPRSEIKMLFKYLATEVRSYEAVVEVLAQVPAAWNGLMPFGFALFHDSSSVKGYILDFFDSLQQYPIGRSFLLSMNAFHRLAYRRLSDQRLVAVTHERDPLVIQHLLADRAAGKRGSAGSSSRREASDEQDQDMTLQAPPPPPLAGLGVEGLELNLGGVVG